jgi:DNA invertase Pin-like site-specific DNA recombinase
MKKKQVICLYRVSTTKQTNSEDDIPVQRAACLEYIDKHNAQYGEEWDFYCEIVEGGVSAYHNSIEDREINQVLKIVADNPDEDFVLLAFYSDRISRQDANGFNFIDKLHKLKVEVWTVEEGRLSIDTEQDRLMLFIKFWGNNNESRKTANRVYAARKMLTEEGKWTGGRVQYGYVLKPTGDVNKKDRLIKDLEKEPFESSIVKEMYDMLVDRNCSLNAIVGELNSRGIKTKRGFKWNPSTIKNILRNPLNKGYISYNKTTSREHERQRQTDSDNWVLSKEKNEKYVIVSEEKWQMAQDILQMKKRNYEGNLYHDLTTKNSLLLSGLLVCGHCGSRISPSRAYQWSGKKNPKRIYIEFYKCNNRARSPKMCAGKTYLSAKKIEGIVLEQVYKYLDGLKQIDCTAELEKMILETTAEDKKLLDNLMKEHSKVQNNVKVLENELIKSLLGESDLSKENINTALNNQKSEADRLEAEIVKIKEKIEKKKISDKEALLVQSLIPVWREVFESASLNVKKLLLSMLIEKIVVKDKDVDIYFKINMNDFLKKLNSYNENGRTEGGSATLDFRTEILSNSSGVNERLLAEVERNRYICFCKDRSTGLSEQIMPEMFPLEAVASCSTEVIVMAVWKVPGNRRKGF